MRIVLSSRVDVADKRMDINFAEGIVNTNANTKEYGAGCTYPKGHESVISLRSDNDNDISKFVDIVMNDDELRSLKGIVDAMVKARDGAVNKSYNTRFNFINRR